MAEQMTFPATWEEYEKFYGFTDKEQVYTNGSRLILSFRVKQWLDHLPSAERKGHWIEHENPKNVFSIECSECGCWFLHEHLVRNSFCPNCGTRMDGEKDVD